MLALKALLDVQEEATYAKGQIEFALTGDMPTLCPCLERILPARKDIRHRSNFEIETPPEIFWQRRLIVEGVGRGVCRALFRSL